jgi:hypothetical protein
MYSNAEVHPRELTTPESRMDPGSSRRIGSTAHLRRKLASLFHADIRFSAHPSPESHTLSTGSVKRFAWQVYKLSATNRHCLQVEYSSTPWHLVPGCQRNRRRSPKPGDQEYGPFNQTKRSLLGLHYEETVSCGVAFCLTSYSVNAAHADNSSA